MSGRSLPVVTLDLFCVSESDHFHRIFLPTSVSRLLPTVRPLVTECDHIVFEINSKLTVLSSAFLVSFQKLSFTVPSSVTSTSSEEQAPFSLLSVEFEK
jgi:hypothetical protein